ncbi:nitroreductase [Pacificimonas sp. WHA3]|uniref:Putative NAD(P)H nitroreductase n=1 Tax=Pacificimonas pallii TaxID=2827236 RepID=A0ABS6SH13_9SPHN|nr:nitroreductase [Pacificimonas pallii]MBV7257697.1 nitroreductase [Pacificimonas pallii]
MPPTPEPMNDRSTPLALLMSRRSGRPRDMVEPAPDAEELTAILTAATRVPDHGKIAPWRFVVIPRDRRDAFAAMLHAAYAEERPNAGRLEGKAIDDFAQQAPLLIAVLHRPDPSRSIPLKEQEWSAAAAAMTLEHAVHASGYVSGWLTGWAAYSKSVTRALGEEGDTIIGFFFIGSPGKTLIERPRPELDEVVSTW